MDSDGYSTKVLDAIHVTAEGWIKIDWDMIEKIAEEGDTVARILLAVRGGNWERM